MRVPVALRKGLTQIATRGAGLLIFVTGVIGCGAPDKVNIQLRKDNQQLQTQVAELKAQHDADRARIEALERSSGTIPTLPQQRIDRLFSVHGITLGRLSGATDLDPRREGDEGLKIYLSPVDETGGVIKATGQVVVEAFELGSSADANPRRGGRWEVTPEQLKGTWRELGPLQEFVITLTWQSPPPPDLLVRVHFTDELTGRQYSAVKQVKVKTPSTRPSTSPAAPSR